MELLLLIIIGIVVLKYIEKKSKVMTIVNAIMIIIFCVLIFYSSESSLIAYFAKKTMNSEMYNILHSALVTPAKYLKFGYSSYIFILFLLFITSFVISAMFTIQTVKNYLKEKEFITFAEEKSSKINFLRYEQKFLSNKFYIVFGRFLS